MTSLLISNVTNGSIPLPSEENRVPEASNQDALILTRIIVQKFCVPLVVFVGVVGNSLSIVVLTRKCMKSSTNSYLTALAIFDLLYLVFSCSLSLTHYDAFRRSYSYVHWSPWCHVFADMSSNVSVTLTVTFTLERYIGVCHPMKGRILCTPQRAKIVTAVVSTLAILCTVPEFWEREVVIETGQNNETYPTIRYTDFANRESYQVGYYWFLVVMFTLLPLILLCVFNGILICTVIKAAKLRREMTHLSPCHSSSAGDSKGGNSQPKEQQKITKMLITVVLVFILCQLPGALLLLYTTYLSLAAVKMSRELGNNLRIAGNVINLLIQINASINFILYSAISTKFRRVFWRTICRRGYGRHNAHGRGMSTLMMSRGGDSVSRTDAIHMSSLNDVNKPGGKNHRGCSSYVFKGRTLLRLQTTDRILGKKHHQQQQHHHHHRQWDEPSYRTSRKPWRGKPKDQNGMTYDGGSSRRPDDPALQNGAGGKMSILQTWGFRRKAFDQPTGNSDVLNRKSDHQNGIYNCRSNLEERTYLTPNRDIMPETKSATVGNGSTCRADV
ncbi:sex peptide receptor [Aplysia californica]|uniref:Sex peptide receptor n=1 Tax=Aplysia californica TaxID=6500 RepID=A0ABM0JRU7_APLCA|nr:sex peptide receptor [Aplysia californica]